MLSTDSIQYTSKNNKVSEHYVSVGFNSGINILFIYFKALNLCVSLKFKVLLVKWCPGEQHNL